MDRRALTTPRIADRDSLCEFADALAEHARRIEQEIARLKRAPGERDAITALFRAVHNIKGDAALCQIDTGVAMAHPVENVLARIRNGELQFTPLLGDVLLLTIDRLELATEALVLGQRIEHLRLRDIVAGLDVLAGARSEDADAHAVALIEHITGFRPAGSEVALRGRGLRSAADDPRTADDLQFFRSLAQQLEEHSPLLKGRTGRILRLALDTNREAGTPIDPVQLEAAVYAHDLGMMFIPEAVWIKTGKLSDTDRLALHRHPGYAAGLLARMPGWEAAAAMVAQHHEMPDGSGYPAGCPAPDIVPGAQVLSIVDAFEAIMLKHAERGRTRSVLRAAAEINANPNQFAAEWIQHFNLVIRRIVER